MLISWLSSPCRSVICVAFRPRIGERFGIPVVYYDADMPMSLPEYGGGDTGFNIYRGADPSEYDLVLSNSEGTLGPPSRLGATVPRPCSSGRIRALRRPFPWKKTTTCSSTRTATSSAWNWVPGS